MTIPEAPHLSPNVPLGDTYGLDRCPARERDGSRCAAPGERWSYGHLCPRHELMLRRGVRIVLVNGARLVRPWAMPARFGWYVIEDVEHGRYDVRAVDTTERDTTKGAK